MIGETVNSYRVISKLSVGGMGTVYRAEHTLIGKLAAVKVLHKELCGSREILQRFFNEAKATTTIKHPGIVDIYDYGVMPSGDAFIIMEFLEGMSLARRLKTKGRMPEGEAAMMLRAVCSALSAAHAKGIVHRDLKPDNIFLVTDPDSPTGERPKVLDFGIAKLTDVGLAGTATKTGAVMGTPTYMSPEQCKGTGDVDHRADLYSLGCIFYELVVGRPPFTKLGAGELIGAHIYAAPEPPSKHLPTLSKETEKLIMSLLQKRPDKRPQTAKELAQRLSQLAQSLGWITVTSPDGVTARSLRDLGSGPVMVAPDAMTPNSLLESRLAETQLPEPSAVTTPYGLDSLSDAEAPSIYLSQPDVEPAEQPTTLSGAASQSVASIHELPKRSRKGVVLALLSVATLAAAAVVVFKVTREDTTKAAKQPVTEPPQQPEVKPEVKLEAPKPEVKAEDPKPEEPKPEVAKTLPAKKTPPKVYTPPKVPPKKTPPTVTNAGDGKTTPPTPDKTTPPPKKKCEGSILDCPNNDKL